MLSKLKVWQSQPDAMDRLEGVGCCRHNSLPAGHSLPVRHLCILGRAMHQRTAAMMTRDAAVMLLELVFLLQMRVARCHQTTN